MDFMYSIMLMIVGVILAIRFIKESKIFILVGAYFIYVGVWRIINLRTQLNLFEGTPAVLFYGISGCVLLIVLLFFGKRFWLENKNISHQADSENGQDEES